MSKLPTEFELFESLPPEQRKRFLAKLLPGLEHTLGDVYDDCKDDPSLAPKTETNETKTEEQET